MKLSRSLKLFGAVAGAALAFSAQAGTTLPGPLVSAAWLKDNLAGVTVLDVRDDMDSFTAEPQFETDAKTGTRKLTEVGGRIEGSLPVDFGKIRVSKTVDGKKIDKMLPDKAAMQEIMQGMGLNRGKTIVIVSAGESADQMEQAARLYWSLKVYGEDRMALLDGGVAAWIAAGNSVTSAKAEVPRGDWKATAERGELLAEVKDVEAAAKSKVQLVDARPLPQYLGLFVKKPAVQAGGHVAGSVNYPTDVRFKSSGLAQMFLSPAEYTAVMKVQGMDAGAPSITYCNTGHMASGMWFIQSEILGNKNVSVYDGSMHEWTTLGKPVVGLGG
jgi:thiosulfate/3-mercaptopyruvate sulfurtransferase